MLMTLARTTRRAVAIAVTAALALTLSAASAVFADDSDDSWAEDDLTLSAELTVSSDNDLRLGIRWY